MSESSYAHAPNAAVLGEFLPVVGRRVRLAGADAQGGLPADTDTLIVAVLQGDDGVELVSDAAFADHAQDVLAGLSAVEAGTKLEATTTIPAPEGLAAEKVLAVGLGSEDPSADDVRRASGAALRAVGKAKHVVSTLGVFDSLAALEGAGLGGYNYPGVKSDADEVADLTVTVLGASDDEVARASAVVDAVCTARDFTNTHSGALFPGSFAAAAEALGKDAGLEVEVLDDAALAEQGYGGIMAVGGGSARPPRLVRMTHKGGGRTFGLVGKGITFDTGGISLKPGASMNTMILDMGGAAAVIATVVLAARLDLPVTVIATVPMAENMPDGKSYRPGDIITQYGGKTVEVLNTDAEGRLILADGLVRACEDNPNYLIDTATLTGAQMIALGSRAPGVLGHDEFRDRVAELSQELGEGGWAMPIPEDHVEGVKSQWADLQNIGPNREGGMSVAAAFLENFVSGETQWVHIDVAAPAFNTHAAWGYTPKRATGVPVRTMLAAIEDIAE
ncbi:leucyl aminopeptidase [Corynebacterium sp. TAE3-ERU12]|uniref:leucyl aminopeptidase n=1 Tax=Corynebacterium sp. TAE3-ERU12 TaxID=2849491 RepID=UPI001C471472|nr:leucyl aminopeptidase [Corynebacterium sp. TAE3-ERU12]MBV7296266.1 leucyl aminopeptidase [Corynebacterium sp. TAE3-ERU12]